MAELLSIIVPVYNGARLLERAISSVLCQTYQNFELILVLDERSTDESEQICRTFSEQHSKVRFVWQRDRGPYLARLLGVQQAKGSYIAFLDADDFVEPDYYAALMAQGTNYDVVLAPWFRDMEGDIRYCCEPLPIGEYCSEQDMEFVLRHLINASLPGGTIQLQPGISAYVWNKLFRAELLKAIFDEIGYQDFGASEDRIISYHLMLHCRSLLVTDVCGYHYWIHNTSYSHSVDLNCHFIRESVCRVYNDLMPIFQQHPMHESLVAQLQFKTSVELMRAVKKMDFPPEAQLQLRTPFFPFVNLLDGRQIALLGAGYVGQSYRRQIQQWNICEIALWVDARSEYLKKIGWSVEPIGSLRQVPLDFVVLAVTEKDEADELREACLSMGFEEKQILWREPLFLD